MITFADMIFKQVLIEEKSHRFNRNSPFVVKIKYIHYNTNIYSIQGNVDSFKLIVSIYNQFLFNVVFRQFPEIQNVNQIVAFL